MIKALEFRFGSASARSLIYLVSGIVVLLGGASLAFFYWQTSEFRKIETLANGYHLATLDACASIKEELFLLEKASDQKSPPQGNGLVLPNQINSSAHIIEKLTDHILLLQDTFRQPEFQATARRLEARTRQLLRLVAAGEAGGEIASALLRKEVASLQVVTGQLHRLHASSYKETVARLTAQQQLNTRNLFIFVEVLLAVGFLVIWRIVVITAAKGPKEKEYAPTVVLAVFLAGGIFLLDLLVPLGVAGAVPYVALVLVSLSLPHRKHTLAAATLASVLTVLGFFLSPAGGTLWVVLTNRGLALFAIWVTAILGLLHKQAEQALRQSEASLAEAQRIAHLGSWEWDIANNRAVWSKEAGRLFGFSPQQLTTTHNHFVESVHPDDWQFVEKAVNEALYEGKPYGVDYRIIRPDGAVRIMHSQGEVSFDQAGKPVRMTGTVQDITERMRAEEALRKQAQIIDQIHDSVVSTDLDGYVTSWNKGAERLFGHTSEEMLGKHIAEVYPPEEHAFLQNQVIAPLRQNGEHEVEVRMRRKSGKDFFAHLSLSLLRDSNGTPTGMIGYSMDITERKWAEQALRQQAQVIDQIHDSVVSTDLDDYITSWNKGAEKLYGYRAEEVLGKHISLVYLDRDRQLSQNQLTGPLLELEEGELEVQRRRKSGELFDIHLSLSLLHDDKGTPIGRIGYSLDITERKRAEENLRALATRLEQSNRELQSFASVAAHDLQEPLRKVLMFGDRLQAKCNQALTDQGRDFLDRMLNAAARMQTLIDDLLAFSRVTTQPQPFAPVDLNAVAREVLSDLEGRIAQEGGRVEIGKLPTIDADRTQMRQLLQNLISNALKFHREEEIPVVSIRGKLFNDRMQPLEGNSPGDGLCQIIVEDNGIGFDQKYADRIFGIFQRLHGRQEFQGTGIGLALCRRIAERHGGSITAQSKPGQGTTFTVRLPIKQHQGEKVA